MPSVEEVGVDVTDPIDTIPEAGFSKGHELVGLPIQAADLFVYLEQDQYVGEKAITREGGWRMQTHLFWFNRTIDQRQWKIMPHIFSGVNGPFEKLKHLNLDGSLTTRGPDGEHLGVEVLCRAYAAEVFPMLTQLNLSANKIECAEAQTLLKALRASKCGRDVLEILHLSNNRLGDASVDLLVDGVLAKLEVLRLDSNMITDVGMAAITSGQWAKLDRLYVQNNLFSDEAIEALSDAIALDKQGPFPKLLMLTVDSFDFGTLYEFRNKDDKVRVGGAPVKLDYAGAMDQGRPREKMTSRDMIFFCTMRTRATPEARVLVYARLVHAQCPHSPRVPSRAPRCALSSLLPLDNSHLMTCSQGGDGAQQGRRATAALK